MQLIRARGQTLWAQTQSLYDRLIIIALSTGLVTAITAGVSLALYVHNPDGNTWEMPYAHAIRDFVHIADMIMKDTLPEQILWE